MARPPAAKSATLVPDASSSTAGVGQAGLRIGDAAARVGVSTRTLRYYDELGLLSPSQYTAGGERRYRDSDLVQLRRILELREALGMNLEEIKEFLQSEQRLDEVRAAYRVEKASDTQRARRQRKALLQEAMALNESLEEQLRAKLARMETFRATLARNAQRCRELLAELEGPST
jgi:MerR family transcriptional regulator, repressor of the yfmOP operon